MKRWIHAASTPSIIHKITEARRELGNYSEDQVAYVNECMDEIGKAISESYQREEDDRPVGPIISEIKRDYLIGAIENDLMTEDEFEEIYDLLDVISYELSAPYA